MNTATLATAIAISFPDMGWLLHEETAWMFGDTPAIQCGQLANMICGSGNVCSLCVCGTTGSCSFTCRDSDGDCACGPCMLPTNRPAINGVTMTDPTITGTTYPTIVPPVSPVRWQGKATCPQHILDFYSAHGVEQAILCTWRWYWYSPQPTDLIVPVIAQRFIERAAGDNDQCGPLPHDLIACCDIEDHWRAAMGGDDVIDAVHAADKYANAVRVTRSEHTGPIDLFKVPCQLVNPISNARRAIQARCNSGSWSCWRTAHTMDRAIEIMDYDIAPLRMLLGTLNQPLYLWTKATRQGHNATFPAGVVPMVEMREWLTRCREKWSPAGFVVLGGDTERGKDLVELCIHVMQ